MLFSFTANSMLAFVAAVVATIIAAVVWTRRPTPGALPFTIFMLAVTVWIVIRTFDIAAVDFSVKEFLGKVLYFATAAVSITWLSFALDYTGSAWGKRPRNFLLLLIIPCITFIILITGKWHGWDWLMIQPNLTASSALVVWAHGPMFWLQVIYILSLLLMGIILLWRFVFSNPNMNRLTMAAILIGTLFPIVAHAVIVSGFYPAQRMDVTPFALTITGIIYAIAIFRFRFLDVVPVARMALVESMPDGILVLNDKSCIIEINPVAASIAGCNKASVLGKKLAQVWLELDEIVTQMDWGQNIETFFETSGEKLYFDISLTSIRSKRGVFVGQLIVLRDITERKKMQEQLIAQDRLASIGELVSGIAHELNNPLSNVTGFTELLLKQESPADIEADLSIINSEAQRAARIVDNLLSFARKQPEDKSPTDINEIIERTLELRTHEQKINDIQTITRFAPSLPKVMGNEFQLRQVFLNIIINAEFFMIEAHGKGTLTIVTEQAGDFIRISFTDDGSGIPQENIARLFDPFFTTKEVGKGTGLGLSICHGIITEHGGSIWVESKTGQGTTFIIELPVYKKPVTGRKQQLEIP